MHEPGRSAPRRGWSDVPAPTTRSERELHGALGPLFRRGEELRGVRAVHSAGGAAYTMRRDFLAFLLFHREQQVGCKGLIQAHFPLVERVSHKTVAVLRSPDHGIPELVP